MNILALGDFIKDVVFLDENNTEMSLAKETIRSGGALDQNALIGVGGNAYMQETLKAIKEHHKGSKITVINHLAMPLKDDELYQPDCINGAINYWTVSKRPQSLSDSKKDVYRITDKPGKNDYETPDTKQPSLNLIETPNIAIISDHNRSIKKGYYIDIGKKGETEHKTWKDKDNNWIKKPSTIKIILLANRLPNQQASNSLWETLRESDDNKKNTILITSIDRLRQEGAKISQRLSWDTTLKEFREVLEGFQPIKDLFTLGNHLIVRVGVIGAIYCYKVKNDIVAQFIYDPNADQQIFRDRSLQGNAFGIRTALPSYIAYHLAKDPSNAHFRRSLIKGIKDSILLSQQIYSHGFGDSPEEVETFITKPNKRIKVFKKCLKKTQEIIDKDQDNSKKNKLGRKWFPHIVDIPKKTANWEILNHNFYGDKQSRDEHTELKELRRLRMARAITFLGIDAAINNNTPPSRTLTYEDLTTMETEVDTEFKEPLLGEISFQNDKIQGMLTSKELYPLCAPIAAYGKLRVLGKEDCESYNSIRNLLSNHLAANSNKPLSIAVFGQPGCGKSFGVTALANALAKEKIEIYSCNVSQLHSQKDLDREFFKIGEILLQGKIPLVFFDEFDSSLGDKELGWLKYFLAPMQDGLYRHDHGYIELKNSIFVFAGGTFNSYQDFSKFITPSWAQLADEHKLKKEWKNSKCPDFVSRLHGHINIGGINGWDDEVKKDSDKNYIHFIRRAIILRSFIERDKKLLDENKVAQIDRNIVDAFLRVSKYEHGARSIGAVLKMCSRWNHRIEKSSLPDENQLGMHVNAKDFLDLALNSGSQPIIRELPESQK